MTLALIGPSGRVTPAGSTKTWPLGGGRGGAPTAIVTPELSTSLLGGSVATWEAIYRTQPWVNVVVNKLARSCARLPLKTYEVASVQSARDSAVSYVSRAEAPSSVPAKLLREPYPRARGSRLIEFIVGSVGVYGNATCVKFRGGNGNTPAQLWPMPWPQVQVVLGTDRPVEAYIYTPPNGGQKKVFLPDDVLHFHWYNPNPQQPFGLSPLESLRSTLALEDAGQRYAISSFGNAARPASFIVSARNMTKEQRAELRAEIDAAYGGPDNAFKVALLDNGLDWKPLAHSAAESELISNRKLSREEVCAVYDIPPPMVGILDNATYSNIDQQHWMMYMDTLAPWLKMLEDTIMAQLVDSEAAWDGYFVEFDLDAVLRGNIEQRSTAYQRFFQSGVRTPNELRKLENLPPIDDPAADAIYVPVNMEGQSGELRDLKEQRAAQAFERQRELAVQRVDAFARRTQPQPEPAATS